MTPLTDTTNSSGTATVPVVNPVATPAAGEPLGAGGSVCDVTDTADRCRVNKLLESLQDTTPRVATQATASGDEIRFENRLAVVRLGMATSLFYALRTKHAATAAHGLRVALSCSAWAERMSLPEESRDRIEVAALLHDLGKIGIPDRILRKPGKLNVDEQLSMDLTAPLACEILRGCTSDQELLDIVLYANCWFDGRRMDDGPRGDQLPLGSRMLAIADAFDSMTTDTVYRKALSRERAIEELSRGAQTQFDPELLVDFSRMLEQRPELLQGRVVNRWLRGLSTEKSQSLWMGRDLESAAGGALASSPVGPAKSLGGHPAVFFDHLIDNVRDGVIFTDREGVITKWNQVMHSLTAITAEAIVGKRFSNEAIRLRNQTDALDNADPAAPATSVVDEVLRTNVCISRSVLIEQPGGEPTPTRMTVSPVSGTDPGLQGTVVIFRDLSDQRTLQAKLKSLHEKTNQDSLTKVANRACLDDCLKEMTSRASRGRFQFSLIICDIDHFKSVNDLHGHQAGDEALIRFADVLKTHSRDDDLVARYGGEEFVLLAANCDNATASNRAEAIRIALEATPLPSLKNASVTASFGVTQFQPGDTAESVLARSDRALLKAKENGRNRVIQLGSGGDLQTIRSTAGKSGWFGWLSSSKHEKSGEFDIVTPVPIDLAIEKLRGFISDHGAEILTVKENQVCIKVSAVYASGGRRRMDHRMAIRAQLTLSQTTGDRETNPGSGKRRPSMTNVHITLDPIRNRDRRGRDVAACFNQVVNGFRSYLMGEVKHSEA